MADEIKADNLILFAACCCCFSALYTDVPACIGCAGKEECLCIEYQVCLKAGATPFPVHCKFSDGYCCQLSLPCCQYGLKMPDKLCLGKGQFCCCVQEMAFPPNDDVPCMCAYLFIACVPKFGVCMKVSDVKAK